MNCRLCPGELAFRTLATRETEVWWCEKCWREGREFYYRVKDGEILEGPMPKPSKVTRRAIKQARRRK